jgi:cation diffusion facilitator family transporter
MNAAAAARPEARDQSGSVDRLLVRLMFLSLAAALVTMALKALAAALTGSVGFLSDALESGVNLVAAIVALVALRVARRPADADHHFGHGKAEYVSALVEGAMIFVAAGVIVWTAVQRLMNPVPLEQPLVGLALTTLASGINLAVGLTLLRAGRRHRSITLVADGKHLLTDVWTSAGVLVGIALVALTGWERLDPIVALAVGVNILVTGYGLVRRSLSGLLSGSLPADDQAEVDAVLARYATEHGVVATAVRTVESGRQRFVFVDLTAPEDWTVRTAHDLADRIEADVAAALPGCTTYIHIEPADNGDGG